MNFCCFWIFFYRIEAIWSLYVYDIHNHKKLMWWWSYKFINYQHTIILKGVKKVWIFSLAKHWYAPLLKRFRFIFCLFSDFLRLRNCSLQWFMHFKAVYSGRVVKVKEKNITSILEGVVIGSGVNLPDLESTTQIYYPLKCFAGKPYADQLSTVISLLTEVWKIYGEYEYNNKTHKNLNPSQSSMKMDRPTRQRFRVPIWQTFTLQGQKNLRFSIDCFYRICYIKN